MREIQVELVSTPQNEVSVSTPQIDSVLHSELVIQQAAVKDVKVDGTSVVDANKNANIVLADRPTFTQMNAAITSHHDSTKQDTITDLDTIRAGAQAGTSAVATISTYGDVVTHDADEFATAQQGAKADTAVQPAAISDMATKTWVGDQHYIDKNVSDLVNYYTSTQTDSAIAAHHDSTKQDALTAGTHIIIDDNNVISVDGDLGKIDDVKVNGTSVVSNKIANVTVPTKTSDITNDSGFITKAVNNLDNYSTTTAMNTAIASHHDNTKYDASNPSGFITSAALSPYSTTTEMNAAIAAHHDSTKQDSLVAGDNITLNSSNNTISATVPVKDVKLNSSSIVDANGSANLQVVDGVSSTSTTAALSANQGKLLNDRIDNLSTIGRFLSVWNCVTGLPTTQPTSLPYDYHSGDYYRIGVVGATNYKPTGTRYTGDASTSIDESLMEVGDVYFYDGNIWSLQINHIGGLVTDVTVDGTSVVSGGIAVVDLSGKQNVITALNQLSADLVSNGTTNKVVTQSEKDIWNAKQSAIDSSHKLASDLVDDTNQTNKFVTTSEKTTWNNKTSINDSSTNSTTETWSVNKTNTTKQNKVTIGNTAPTSPDYGDEWLDTSTSGGVAWGDLDGNISDQSDLSEALNDKINKVSSPTVGNVPQLDSGGSITNGLPVVDTQGIPITTSITSSSTDEQIPSAKAVKDGLDAKVGFTDYAQGLNAGVIKVGTQQCVALDNGWIYPLRKTTYSDYTNMNDLAFVGKATLETALTGKNINNITNETWTFTLSDGTTVTKTVKVGS